MPESLIQALQEYGLTPDGPWAKLLPPSRKPQAALDQENSAKFCHNSSPYQYETEKKEPFVTPRNTCAVP